MRRRSVTIVLGACVASCGLFPDLSDLTASDAASPTDAVPNESAPPNDVGVGEGPVDAACPTITRVQSASYPKADTQTAVSVTMNITEGHLLVALFGAQFPGTITMSDTANTPWTFLTEIDNYACVTDASPWGSRARIAYATIPASVANDVITVSTNASPDYLALTVAEYAASGGGTLAFTTSSANTASSASNTITLPALQTTGCTNLVVAMIADEDPGNDQWTPLSGFTTLSSEGNWSFVTLEDVAAPPGSVVAGASHPASDSCWVTAGASFAAQ